MSVGIHSRTHSRLFSACCNSDSCCFIPLAEGLKKLLWTVRVHLIRWRAACSRLRPLSAPEGIPILSSPHRFLVSPALFIAPLADLHVLLMLNKNSHFHARFCYVRATRDRCDLHYGKTWVNLRGRFITGVTTPLCLYLNQQYKRSIIEQHS